ncbi:MAG: pitrilysin family protein [Nitrospiraceae bacterium]|nr:pitrilysin family protein [Nitrospiraceae bacterium]
MSKTMKHKGLRRLPVIVALALFPLISVCAGWAYAGPSPEVLRAQLKNGLRVVIIKDDLAPVVTTEMNYLVGSNESPDGFPGTAHAQEHMMFRGSPGLSADQLSDLVSAMGGRFNADTQQTVTQYFFTVPADDLDIALRIEAIRMSGVLDSQQLWEEERGAIEQEVAQDLSNPLYVFYSTLLSKVFPGTPYAHDALGTRPSFNKTTGEMLKAFHEDWYGPNNAILVITGSVDPKKALGQVERFFGGIPSRKTPPRPGVSLRPMKPDTINLETDLSYGVAILAYRLPGLKSPDFAAAQILTDVLDSQRAALYALVPEGKALSADFNMTMLPEAGLGYATAAFPKGADGRQLVPVIKEIIGSYIKNGFPAELVDAAKRRETADAEYQMNSISELASLWSQALAVEGRNSPQEDIDAIRKVSVADVNRVAKEYLDNDTAIVAILTPKPSGKAVASRGFGRKESLASKKMTGAPLPKWAAKVKALPPVPVFRRKPSVTVLPNGLRLIVQPEKISNTVSVYGRVKNNADLETPSGKEGVALVLDGLFSYGTTTLDRLAFQKALDDIAADESAGTSFSVRVLSDKFDRGVELLADNLLRPALPEKAFKVVREEISGALAGKLQSPSYLAGIALRSALYPKGDPTLRQPTPETVSNLSPGDVRSYYGKVFRPDMTTIVVIGNVSTDEAKAVIGKYFGDWKSAGPKPETELPAVPANRPSSVSVPDASRVQSEVTLAETLGLNRKDPGYYTLQVGVHVLAGGFYSTRLYKDLREKTGLVYTVDAVLEAGKTRSLFAIEYACDPDNVQKARAIVERDLKEMQAGAVTAAELHRAKSLLIRQVSLSESSTDVIASMLLDLALKDLPLDEPARAAKDYRKITARQVKAAFSKWIRPGDFAEVILAPPAK